jgi:hypothetical protein
MGRPLNLDIRARAELLTYLVASQLLAKTTTGEWLAIKHVVESEQIWLSANGGGTDWLERVSISSWSQQLAQRLVGSMPVDLNSASATSMFCENPRLDFRVPFVRRVYQCCLTYLVVTRWFV